MAAPRKYPGNSVTGPSGRPWSPTAPSLRSRPIWASTVKPRVPGCAKPRPTPASVPSSRPRLSGRLRKENDELKRVNEILKAASALFAAERGRPRMR